MLQTFIYVVTISLVYASNESLDIERKFELLQNQIHILKSENAENKAEIAGLKADYSVREQALRAEISDIRSQCRGGSALSHAKRLVSQTPVAFYAIAPDFDFQAMRVDQNLIFAKPFVNLGNAFFNSTGIFFAPLDGVYVITVTIGANNHNSNYYYIDVAGTRMGEVLQLYNSASQSSQTIVASLKPGDPVSVKAGRQHDGAYGGYFTSFGGFLLYENFNHIGVGK